MFKDYKTQHWFKAIFEDTTIKRSGLKLQLFQEILGIKYCMYIAKNKYFIPDTAGYDTVNFHKKRCK